MVAIWPGWLASFRELHARGLAAEVGEVSGYLHGLALLALGKQRGQSARCLLRSRSIRHCALSLCERMPAANSAACAGNSAPMMLRERGASARTPCSRSDLTTPQHDGRARSAARACVASALVAPPARRTAIKAVSVSVWMLAGRVLILTNDGRTMTVRWRRPANPPRSLPRSRDDAPSRGTDARACSRGWTT